MSHEAQASTSNASAEVSDKKTTIPVPCPVQDNLKKEIILLGQEIDVWKKKNDANLCTDGERRILREKENQLQILHKKLKRKQGDVQRQIKFRENRKRNLTEIVCENPELKKKLHVKEKVS